MSEYTQVQFGQMAASEADFASVCQSLQGILTTLEGQLNATLTQWSGTAQAAYHVEKGKWDTAAADMATVVSQLGQVIGVANDNYTSAERVNSAMWGS